MTINNYAVSMDSQYFNLKRETNDVKVSTQTDDFSNGETSEVNSLEMKTIENKYDDEQLSVELSKALLKNITYESNIRPIDKVEISHRYEEKQALNFQVQAFIQTDSQEIELSLDVSLSSSFTYQSKIDIEDLKQRELDIYHEMKDPLIISLDGGMPTLSTKTFSFDIDSDGESDQISQLGAGSAFLAYDKNSNSKIDNGNELFGTKSGDGFADLSEYDDDKNGWIDENDAIFDKLRIWQKDGENDKLIALGEVGIGAIFLGDTTTPFELKSDSNALLGEIKSSGFFVYENGTAGVISHLDLAVDTQTQDGLDNLKKIQKGVQTSNLGDSYSQKTDTIDNKNSNEEQIKKLDDKIRSLENKLSTADEKSKPIIQAQIAGLQAQRMII